MPCTLIVRNDSDNAELDAGRHSSELGHFLGERERKSAHTADHCHRDVETGWVLNCYVSWRVAWNDHA